MATACVYFAFESNLTKAKEILHDALSCVEKHFPYISESDLFDLRIVFNELLVNAVTHGNRADSSKMVELLIELDHDEIMSIIRDEGYGFNSVDILEQENNIKDILGEHGRGLQLVYSLTEHLNISSTGNEIEFHKKILRQQDEDIE